MCLFRFPLNQPEVKQWSSGFVGLTVTIRMPDDRVGNAQFVYANIYKLYLSTAFASAKYFN